GGLGAISGPHLRRATQRRATAPPGRDERRGAWGPFRGPISVAQHRGASRLRRGATNVGGLGGHFGAPSPSRNTEARHGSAGARRASGGLGAISGPHLRRATQRRATAPPGRDERRGAWGPFRGPISVAQHRGAPRLRRGATNVVGLGGHFGAPSPSRNTEARHGSAGARRT